MPSGYSSEIYEEPRILTRTPADGNLTFLSGAGAAEKETDLTFGGRGSSGSLGANYSGSKRRASEAGLGASSEDGMKGMRGAGEVRSWCMGANKIRAGIQRAGASLREDKLSGASREAYIMRDAI